MCLHEMFVARYSFSKKDQDKEYAVKALKRGLDVAFHAGAIGMIGWVEYGSCNPLERAPERPLLILSNLAAFHGFLGDWGSAIDTMQSLVLCCKQQFPLYHPFTLSSILDQAMKCGHRARQRLAFYLGEQEQAYFVCRNNNVYGLKNGDSQFGSHQDACGLDHLSMLKAFSSHMRRLQGRKMTQVLGPNHPIILLFHCFLGDTLSVLANCIASSRSEQNEYEPCYSESLTSVQDHFSLATSDRFIWEIAGKHYRTAMKGWVKLQGLRHPNVPATVCGMAGCLRELGR